MSNREPLFSAKNCGLLEEALRIDWRTSPSVRQARLKPDAAFAAVQ